MATGRTDRSTKPLHNFTMPLELRWGSRKHLRCMKVNSDGRIAPLSRSTAVRSNSSDRRREDLVGDGNRGREKDEYPKFLHGSMTPYDGGRRFCDGGGDGIAALREKVMFDLQTEVNTMKCSIFNGSLLAARGLEGGSPPPKPAAAEGGGARTSLTACATTVRFGSSVNGDGGGGENVSAGGTMVKSGSSTDGSENDSAGVGKGLTVDALKPDSGFSQMTAGYAVDKLRLRSSGGGRAAIGEKRERRKFAVALSKSEIEEDLFGMTGHRPARRPKKRARNVQRKLNALFPGFWLTEITADMYKVAETASRQKW